VIENARLRGWETLGVEFVEGALEHTVEVGVPVVRSPLWDLDVVDGRFDAVHTLSLEHVPDVPLTLRQIREHLRPGGFFVVEAPNQFEAIKEVAKAALIGIVGDRLLDHVYNEANQTFHLSFFTPRTLRSAVEGAGFEVLEMRTYMPWNPVYHFNTRFRVSKELVYLLGGFVGRGPSTELIARAP
jgi:2-polyprenyl-3-methyl-5-hydroxy-6-metoxy-1,4-benzoquinol methylase